MVQPGSRNPCARGNAAVEQTSTAIAASRIAHAATIVDRLLEVCSNRYTVALATLGGDEQA
jgi:hypothetical protein